MKKILICMVISFFFFTMPTYATELSTGAVKVNYISVYSSSGDVLVQTTPKHFVTGLSCSSNFWLVLENNTAAFKETYATLLLAYAIKSEVIVFADDNISGSFCKLSRVILSPASS